MNSESNIKVLLAARPKGYPRNEDFLVIESEIPKIKEGELLVKIDWLSLDPYMRGRMNDVKSYAPSVEVGDVMVGGAVGTIINHAEHKVSIEHVSKLMKMLPDGFPICACAADVEEARALAELGPTFIAVEPPELIGGDISVNSLQELTASIH